MKREPPEGYIELDLRTDLDTGRPPPLPTSGYGMPGNVGALHAIEYTNTGLLERTRETLRRKREARWWTLVEMPDGAAYVAARRTLWWALVTAWLNVGRRALRRRRLAERERYFSDAQMAARARKLQ